MKISMIAEIGEGNRVLGKENKLLWHIAEDMKFFREKTRGHPVIMGRKTFESIGKPLPNRTNIVITHDIAKFANYLKEKGLVVEGLVPSIEEAISYAKNFPENTPGNDEIFIIGGGQIYAEGINYADRIYLTVVQGSYEGDAFFPDYSEFNKVVSRRESEGNGYKYTFLVLEK